MSGCPGDETLLVLVGGSLASAADTAKVDPYAAVTETMNPRTQGSGS
jgi:hypothetical protein